MEPKVEVSKVNPHVATSFAWLHRTESGFRSVSLLSNSQKPFSQKIGRRKNLFLEVFLGKCLESKEAFETLIQFERTWISVFFELSNPSVPFHREHVESSVISAVMKAPLLGRLKSQFSQKAWRAHSKVPNKTTQRSQKEKSRSLPRNETNLPGSKALISRLRSSGHRNLLTLSLGWANGAKGERRSQPETARNRRKTVFSFRNSKNVSVAIGIVLSTHFYCANASTV